MTTNTVPYMETKTQNTAAQELQDTLVELIDLALIAKQAHWNVTGRNFRSVHLHLDEMVEEYRTWSDDVAERAVTLGTFPDGRASAVNSQSKVEKFPASEVKDSQVIDLLVDRLNGVIERMRGRVERLETEPITQDLLIGVTQGLEKQHWMLRMQKS